MVLPSGADLDVDRAPSAPGIASFVATKAILRTHADEPPSTLVGVNDSTGSYDERLRAPLRWWVQATLLVASFWLAVVVALPFAAAWLVTGMAAAFTAGLLLAWGRARVQVENGWFRAGRASIQIDHVGQVRVLDAEQTRRIAGVDADARAYLLLRPYLKRAVQVELVDPRDPTPYWLVNTRRPQALATTLAEVRDAPPGAARVDHPYVQED